MKKQLTALAAALVFLAPAHARAAAAETFRARCASCHGKDGKGKTKMGERFSVPNLTAIEAPASAIEKTIANGKGKMMPYKDKLDPDEIQDLAAYIKDGLK